MIYSVFIHVYVWFILLCFFFVVSCLGISNIDINNVKKNNWYRQVLFHCQWYTASAAYSCLIYVPLPQRQLCNRWRCYTTPFFHAKKNTILLSIDVISRPLLFTKIIGVCCEKHTKSVNRMDSKNSVMSNEARGIYSNHCGLSD